MRTISLCMIVKNEEKYIKQCLESVASIVNEIIIVDTGSQDKTIEIASQFQAKICNYSWNNDFGAARNFSLDQATSDWIIVLDADEAIHPEDLQKLYEYIQNTDTNAFAMKLCNYMDANLRDNYTVHMGLRVFKNGDFRYDGAIHEQLQPVREDEPLNIETTEIRLLHYGYIKAGSDLKKRIRNMTIIQKQLEKNPNDSFQLFNMGNEFMSQKNYKKAIKYYDKANANKVITMAYSPHLIYRRAVSLHELNRDQESLSMIAEGLHYYSKCTDLEYLRGIVYKKMKKYLLAVESFKKCIAMGETPSNLKFFDGMHSYRPLIELGQIYYNQGDYNSAIQFYMQAIQLNGDHYVLIYQIGKALNKMISDKDSVCKNLENLFGDLEHLNNRLVFIDVLITEGLYDKAAYYIKELNEQAPSDDILFIQGRMDFYTRNYDAALAKLNSLLLSLGKKHMLPQVREVSLILLTVCCLTLPEKTKLLQSVFEAKGNEIAMNILLYLEGKGSETLNEKEKNFIICVLKELLKLNEVKVFQNITQLLLKRNMLSHLDIAEIYCENGDTDLAIDNVIKSIVEYTNINEQTVEILKRAYQ